MISMLFWRRSAAQYCRLTLMLLTAWMCPMITASGIDPEPRLKDLERQLLDGFGDAFEFVRGVRVPKSLIPRSVDIDGGWEEWWFAELRAKRAGDFGLSYSTMRSATVSPYGGTIEAVTYGFLAPIKIYPKGTRRYLELDQGTISNPQANVGDIVVLPVCLDQKLTNYVFHLFTGDDREVSVFMNAVHYQTPKRPGFIDADLITVESAADRPVQIIESSAIAIPKRSTGTVCSISARLEFTKIGRFNLSTHIASAQGNEKSYPFQVVAKDEPITTILGVIRRRTSHGANRLSTSGGASRIPWGTVAARLGDQLSLDCGSYFVSATQKNSVKRTATIKVQPFNATEIYPAQIE